eukprot:TRINITY_DN13863_c1_g1_i1.p1 TRINITY_DN13863_c1_g1~~TRINITY_DN13863_c1_g1_i1.p1  ORF type:complete len:795 (+),score=304.06 TRINITY_DN13863_c1_g1_i1:3-2387(+)
MRVRREQSGREEARPTNPFLDNWKNNVACAVNVGNCEGGGGLVHKRVMSPPTAGDTPLIVASQFCHLSACRKMVSTNKADVGLRNHEGFDAHDIAVMLQHRYEMQPIHTHTEGEDDDYGAAQRAVEHEKNSSRVLEKNVEMFNATFPVQKKLFHFALWYFVKSLFHIFSFALVVTVLSMLTVQDRKKFFVKDSLSQVIDSEEWSNANLVIDNVTQSWSSFPQALGDIGELEDLSSWFNEPFQSKVFGEQPYGMFQLVGKVRVAKQDMRLTDCMSISHTTFFTHSDKYKMEFTGPKECGGIYDPDKLTNDTIVWGNWDVPRPTFTSRYSWTTYQLGIGEYVELHPNDMSAMNDLVNMDFGTGGFVDANTRFVATHFTFYNTYIDVFVVCQIFFEIFAQGFVQSTSRYRAVRINTYQTNDDMFRASLEIIFCLFLIVQTMSQMVNFFVMSQNIHNEYRREQHTGVWNKVKHFLSVAKESFNAHVMSNWTVLDLALLCLQYVLFVLSVRVIRLQGVLSSKVGLLDNKGDVFYDDFIPLMWLVHDQEGWMGWIVLLSWIKCLKSLARLPSYGPIVNALISTMTNENLFVFLFVFMWVLLSFYLAMLSTFSTSVTDFRLFAPAALTLFKMVLGDTDDLDSMEAEAGWMGPLFFVLVVVFCQLVLLNLIVAVLSDIYVTAINNAHSAWSTDIVSIYRYTLTGIVQPNSVSHVVMQYLRKNGFLNFKEKHLKRPLAYPRTEETGRPEGRAWMVVPLMGDDEENDGDVISEVRDHVEALREEVKQLKGSIKGLGGPKDRYPE